MHAIGFKNGGPIFRFIGSKTGPKFEVEMGNYNNKKNHLPPGVWVASVRLTRCDFDLCARTVRGFNNGAGMLYNIAAPILNPWPGPILERTISGPQTPF